MPQLSSIPQTTDAKKVLIYGQPKTGKTLAVGNLAKLGYTLHWFDIEDGSQTLRQLPPEAQARINLYKIRDTAENQYAAKTLLKILNWRNVGPVDLCVAHGFLNCPACKAAKEPFDVFDITKLGPRDIIVVDSITQLNDSIRYNLLPNIEAKAEFDHWATLGVRFDSLTDWMKSAKCHVIFITHEQETEVDEGPAKITPVGGTKNYAKQFARSFGEVIYFKIKNGKHTAMSKSTALNNVVTGSRVNANTEDAKPNEEVLQAIFPKLEPETA